MYKSLLFAVAFAMPAHAVDEKPIKGTFLMAVDDHATVFVNGTKVFHGDIGSSRSPETEIKLDDRIVVHLVNDIGPKQFILVFASTDGRSTISFRAGDFKVVPGVGVTDFTTDQFKLWPQSVRKFKGTKGLDKAVKNYSDWIWGDLDRCAIACTITRSMFARPN